MDWRRFLRSLAFGVLITTVLSCILIVPPWSLRALWGQVDAIQQTGLVCLGGFLVIVTAATAYQESRR